MQIIINLFMNKFMYIRYMNMELHLHPNWQSVLILSFPFSKAYTVFSCLQTCFYRLLLG